MQTLLLELSKFQPVGSLQEEIAKKFCSFQIREKGVKLNSATQNAIGYALARLLDNPRRQRQCVQVNNQRALKEVFTVSVGTWMSLCATILGHIVTT
jgi:hypothetical protein